MKAQHLGYYLSAPRRPVVYNEWADDSQIHESVHNSLHSQSAASSKFKTLNSADNSTALETCPVTANKRSSPVVRIDEEEVDETLHLAKPLENSRDSSAELGSENADNDTLEAFCLRITEHLEIRPQTKPLELEDTKETVLKSCVQLSKLGQLSFDIGQILSDKTGKFSESFLKEAEKRMKDAMSIAIHWNMRRRAPENASYLLALSLRNQLAEYFRAAFAIHTKLQLSLKLFPMNY
uniref:Uncharacterized protein n=1 Tax=Ditylenchus dipsaci TaxID=166011 RepID=A0A915EBE2_9BILA